VKRHEKAFAQNDVPPIELECQIRSFTLIRKVALTVRLLITCTLLL
jgi:hypothetical protein